MEPLHVGLSHHWHHNKTEQHQSKTTDMSHVYKQKQINTHTQFKSPQNNDVLSSHVTMGCQQLRASGRQLPPGGIELHHYDAFSKLCNASYNP